MFFEAELRLGAPSQTHREPGRDKASNGRWHCGFAGSSHQAVRWEGVDVGGNTHCIFIEKMQQFAILSLSGLSYRSTISQNPQHSETSPSADFLGHKHFFDAITRH